ncbi:ABC transporter ATP-binding protein [Nakamurella silvestris]|nr:ABC transporter ATP-binding protein [Nakamurella silvestris]
MAVPPGVTGLDRATVVRDGSVVLHEVTLLAEPGELLVVLGPSGSGKSTLLRAIAGLDRLSAGTVLIAGTPTSSQTHQRDLAMVFERTHLNPVLDVAGNMAFGLLLHQTPKEEAQRKVEEQARLLRLSRLLKRRPTGLSAGEHGQVGIGRALVRVPKAFLLDEPLAHLDAQERVRMRHLIADAVKATGVSTIYVTHDQTEALSIADRIAVLNAGEVVQIARPQDLYLRPASIFVADFVGHPSLTQLPARLVESGGMAGYRVGARTLPTWAPVPPELAGHVGREVILGVRPEDIQEAAPDSDPDRAWLPGTVVAAERLGSDTYLTISTAGHRIVGRFPGWNTARVGDAIDITVDAASMHVFDAGTGVALHHPDV